MIGTVTPPKPLDTFTLELPKGDTAYERSLDDERNGRVNHYESSEEFFKKMGI